MSYEQFYNGIGWWPFVILLLPLSLVNPNLYVCTAGDESVLKVKL